MSKTIRFLKKGTFLLLSLYLFFSFISYSYDDASWSVLNSSEKMNLGGSIGAIVVDITYMIFGYAYLPIVLMTWVLYKASIIRRKNHKVLLFLVSSILNVLSVATLPVNDSWRYATYSGCLGFLIIQHIPMTLYQYIIWSTILGHTILIYYIYRDFYHQIKRKTYMLLSYMMRMFVCARNAVVKYYGILCRLCCKFFSFSKKKRSSRLEKNISDISKIRDEKGVEKKEIFDQYREHIISITEDSKRPIGNMLPQEQCTMDSESIDSNSMHDNAQDPTPVARAENKVSIFKKPTFKFFKHKVVTKAHSKTQYVEVAKDLETVLNDFGIEGKIVNYHLGPVVTLYELELLPGVKSSRVTSLANDIARSLCVASVRISVVSGKSVLCIEIPNKERELVVFRDFLEHPSFNKKNFRIPIALGSSIFGEPVFADLTKMPHLLVAGTTGSGKSVAINVMLLSIIYSFTPQECKLILVDPKMLEFSVYDHVPYLLTPVVTEPKKAVNTLKWATKEMEDRYRKMSLLSVRNIEGYNSLLKESFLKSGDTECIIEGMDHKVLPYIVIIIDEMADLMLVTGKEIEGLVQRLSQMARAAGIHLIMATQRPSVDVITGVIKANFPTRISFAVSSKIDSRTILGEQGAEQLLGKGDMLYMPSGQPPMRLHAPFVTDREVTLVIDYLKTQGEPEYMEEIGEVQNDIEMNPDSCKDSDLFQLALDVIYRDKRISVSYLQRKLKIGFNRAAGIIEEMESRGIISKPNAVGKREILIEDRDQITT